MSYLKDGVEYLTGADWDVYQAVKDLNRQGRTTNNSQLARQTGLSSTTVGRVTTQLHARNYLRNVGKGAAYHWRTTGKEALRYRDEAEQPQAGPVAPHAQYAATHGAVTYKAGDTSVDATDLAAEALAEKLARDSGHTYVVGTASDGSLVVALKDDPRATLGLTLRTVKYAAPEDEPASWNDSYVQRQTFQQPRSL